MCDLQVRVIEVRGHCPIYKKGDAFTIAKGYILKTDTGQPICMHSLASIMPYYVALSRGIPPKELDLGNGEKAYVQCLDPYEFTNGGTVIFEIRRETNG